MLVFVHALGFFQKSFLHHFVYSPVDAVVEFLTVSCEAYLDDAERTFLLALSAEGSVGFSGQVSDFEGMNHSFRIFQINDVVIFRVEEFQFGT